MEKFSRWRDASTGIAPFNQPVPPSLDSQPAWTYVLLPVTSVLPLVRMALYMALMGLKLVLGDIFLLLMGVPKVHEPVLHASTYVCCRLALLVLGFYWIPVESGVSLKRTSSRVPLPPAHPGKGDLIVSNWSSYVEILYLSCRYNVTLLQAVLSPTGTVIGFKRVGVFRIQTLCGRPPATSSTLPKKCRPLEHWLATSNAPVVVFPELTTSNNRAVLRFANLSTAPSPISTPKSPTRAFLFHFKHDVPSLHQSTATLPIPTLLNPFPHLFSLCQSLSPRMLTVRSLHPMEAPRAELHKAAFWTACGEALAALGKQRVTIGVGWQDKQPFLDFYNKAKR